MQLVRLLVAFALFLLAQTAAAQSNANLWYDARANTSRTGTVDLRWNIEHPHLAWRVQRSNPTISNDGVGVRVLELELTGQPPLDLVGLTDRGMVAYDGENGRRLWPADDSEFFPLTSIVGYGDLNGDNSPEIVAIGRDNVVAIYDRRGRRRWALPSNALTSNFLGEVRLIQTATANPHLALLVIRNDNAGPDRTSIRVLEFDENFTETVLAQTTFDDDNAVGALHTAVGDFDEDGYIDLLVLRVDAAGFSIAPFRRVDQMAAWPNPVVFSPQATMGCSCAASNESFRIEVYREPEGRDRVAFKRTCTVSGPSICWGVLGTTNAFGLSVLSVGSGSGSDTSQGRFVEDLIPDGTPSMELVVQRVDAIDVVATSNAARRVVVANEGSAQRPGLIFQGLAQIGVGSQVSLLGSLTTSSAKQFVRWNAGGITERSVVYDSITTGQSVLLNEGFNRYRFPQPTRRELVVIGRGENRAVIGQDSNNLLHALRFDQDRQLPISFASAVVGHRPLSRGALTVGISFRPQFSGVRRIDDSGGVDPPALLGDGAVVHPLMGAPFSINLGTSAHAELRGFLGSTAPAQLLVSPARGAVLDPTGFNPFESLASWNAGTCANPDDRGTLNSLTEDGTLVYVNNTDPPTIANTFRYDAMARACTALTPVELRMLGVTGAPTQFSLDFFSSDVNNPGPISRAIYGYGLGNVLGSDRPVTPLSLTRAFNLNATVPAAGFNVASTLVTPMPVAAKLGMAPAVTNVAILTEAANVPLNAARRALVTFLDTNLRTIAVPIGNSAATMSAMAPSTVRASNGDALLVNNGPSAGTSALLRATLWRFSLDPTPRITLAAVGPADSLVDSTAGVVVRCGPANSGRYRFIYKHRASSTNEDARFEALEFNNAPSELPLPANAAAWAARPSENFSVGWRLCLDHPNNDCAIPLMSPKYARALYASLAAVQNGDDPVVVMAATDGSLTAVGHVCGPTMGNDGRDPTILWRYAHGRALSALSMVDSDGDGVAEIVGLSSDGTYNAITEEECNRPSDPRCPAARPYCDVATRSCVQCNTDADCERSVGGTCNTERHVCEPCSAMSNCAIPGGTCVRRPHGTQFSWTCDCDAAHPCNRGYSCVGPDPIRNLPGQCVAQCSAGSNICPPGFACEIPAMQMFGSCVPSCQSDQQCAQQSPTRPVCRAPAMDQIRQCVECETNAQCAATHAEAPICAEHRCVQCTAAEASACTTSAAGSACLPTGQCGCLVDRDCPMAQSCESNTGRCRAIPTPPMRFVDTTCACSTPGALPRGPTPFALCAMAALLAIRRSRQKNSKHLSSSVLAMGLATWLAASSRAFAQTATPPRAVQCGEEANPELFNDARDRFEAGQTALLGGDGVAAERALREALAIYESPNTVLLLARALRAQSRLDEAYEAFEATIALATRCSIRDNTDRGRARYARSLEAAAIERSQLASQVALLGLHFANGIPAETTIEIDQRPAIAVTGDRVYAASAQGERQLRVSAPRHRPWIGTIQLSVGRVSTAEVRLEPIVEGPRIVERIVRSNLVPVRRTSPLFLVGNIVGTVGLAVGGTGLGLYLSGRGRYNELAMSCTPEMCPPDASFLAAVDRAERAETAGRVLLIGGGVVAATGLTLLLIGLPRTEWVAQTSVRAMIFPTEQGASVVGVF